MASIWAGNIHHKFQASWHLAVIVNLSPIHHPHLCSFYAMEKFREANWRHQIVGSVLSCLIYQLPPWFIQPIAIEGARTLMEEEAWGRADHLLANYTWARWIPLSWQILSASVQWFQLVLISPLFLSQATDFLCEMFSWCSLYIEFTKTFIFNIVESQSSSARPWVMGVKGTSRYDPTTTHCEAV